MSILKAAAASKTARTTVVLGMAAAAVVATATSSSAAAAALTVTQPTGATTGATLTLTAAANTFRTASGTLQVANTGGTLDANAIQLNIATACPSAPASTAANSVYNVATATVVSGAKIVVTTGAVAAKKYNVCVYKEANTAAVLANGKYTAYAPPTYTGIDVASGPVFGGGTVTVDGTNFTTGTTAKLGGVAMTNIKVNKDGTSFTATVPANSAGAKNLVITTEGGPVTGTNAYTYRNGLAASPQTMVGNTKQVIDVTGYGFSDTAQYDFTADASVLLVKGNYDPADDGNGAKTNGEVKVCGSVVVVSDTNLICTLDGAAATIADGAYTLVAVNDDQLDADTANNAYSETIINSLATITVAPY